MNNNRDLIPVRFLYLPLMESPGADVNFATSTILTANCCPVSRWMHRRTKLNGPLEKNKEKFFIIHRIFWDWLRVNQFDKEPSSSLLEETTELRVTLWPGEIRKNELPLHWNQSNFLLWSTIDDLIAICNGTFQKKLLNASYSSFLSVKALYLTLFFQYFIIMKRLKTFWTVEDTLIKRISSLNQLQSRLNYIISTIMQNFANEIFSFTS